MDDFRTPIHIPILDEPISEAEVEYVISNNVKPNKSCGPDGISPGLFKLLPVNMIMHLTMLLNLIFTSTYPAQWTFEKLVMLFKKGSTLMCSNYRGISIINSIAKIYDYVLYNHLSKWYVPDREQAGGLPKRGCIEHISV